MSKPINDRVATKVLDDVNAKIGENPALAGWNLYADRNAEGVTGFGASYKGGAAAVPDPLMQVITETFRDNGITGASFKVRG